MRLPYTEFECPSDVFGLRIFDFAYIPFNSTDARIQLPSLRIAVSSVEVEIKDDGDAGIIEFSRLNYTTVEGDKVQVTLFVTRVGLDAYATPATFTYQTIGAGDSAGAASGFNAVAGLDFVPATGDLTFAPAQGALSVVSFPVLIQQDDVFEYPGALRERHALVSAARRVADAIQSQTKHLACC